MAACRVRIVRATLHLECVRRVVKYTLSCNLVKQSIISTTLEKLCIGPEAPPGNEEGFWSSTPELRLVFPYFAAKLEMNLGNTQVLAGPNNTS
jgi:hypothetical protein